ncbi:hypothetical protein Tco_0895807 [Tanacetum coccineum]|uniref:Uncharacterized protein n=1 Tax=Tanacetum coccineum TaxID=301880 RepID=A0ABQ5CFM4_9ASTR
MPNSSLSGGSRKFIGKKTSAKSCNNRTISILGHLQEVSITKPGKTLALGENTVGDSCDKTSFVNVISSNHTEGSSSKKAIVLSSSPGNIRGLDFSHKQRVVHKYGGFFKYGIAYAGIQRLCGAIELMDGFNTLVFVYWNQKPKGWRGYLEEILNVLGTVRLRVSRSRIDIITNSLGNVFENDQVATAFVDHYSTFLGQADTLQHLDTNDLFYARLLDQDAANMVSVALTTKEVKRCYCFFGNDQSPGLMVTQCVFKRCLGDSWGSGCVICG